jgi:hypothetical protein
VGVTVSSTTPRTTPRTTPGSPTFAERLRAAHEQEQKPQRRSILDWVRGPRAGFAPDVAIEPHDRPRLRDEYVKDLAG